MKFFRTAIILFLFVALGAVKAFAQSSSELKRQREEISQQIEKLNRDLEETSKNKRSTLKQLDAIRSSYVKRY